MTKTKTLTGGFVSGDEVEVISEEEGLAGAYFAASVARSLPILRRYTVSHHSLLSDRGGPLRETIDARLVRPRPPSSSSPPPNYRLHDCVDAFHRDAWWSGVVVSPGSASASANVLVVCFPLYREVLSFDSSQIRPHLEWLSDRWVPPSLLEMPASVYKEGSRVEVARVKDDNSATFVAWSPAVVAKRIWKNNYLVQYSHLVSTKIEPVQEIVDIQHLRPCPCHTSVDTFCVNDAVEAFYDSSWWPGTLLNIYQGPVRKYAVRLPNFNTDMDFEQLHLRPCFRWVDGKWLQPSQRNADPNMKFQKGMHVEVSSDEEGFKGAWFTATIIRPVGTSFCVEYHDLRIDDETALLQETVDPIHIRPTPPVTRCAPDPLRLLEEVDAYCNGGWWAGVVSKVVGKNQYVVYFRQWKEEMEFGHDVLRPHFDWVGGRWDANLEGMLYV
ncbi:Agenet domain-containing protein [Carex littledalei]|uniref:Agenet domain-containing protein n=1 Tax=Carex littledalei TaxID=544730 RepID=A0A833RFU2_9POAL|nr:Agenet domain-containing protein [Carex littledalei]